MFLPLGIDYWILIKLDHGKKVKEKVRRFSLSKVTSSQPLIPLKSAVKDLPRPKV